MVKNYEIEITKVEMFKGRSGNQHMCLSWDSNVGFGQLNIALDKNGNITAETESMGKEFLKQCLIALCDKINIIE